MAQKTGNIVISLLLVLTLLLHIVIHNADSKGESEISHVEILQPEHYQSEMPLSTNWWAEGQQIDIAMSYYYGDWLIGQMVGSGYVYDAIDPKGVIVGGILSLEENKAIFYGPQNTLTLDNPEYRFILQAPSQFTSQHRRASYGSFEFPNAYVVRIDIYDGDKQWLPESLGPLWIKDIDTMIVEHHVFHVMRRIES